MHCLQSSAHQALAGGRSGLCEGSRRPGIWEVYTHTPGGKPVPGFTFGIARPLLCAATMSPGSNGWRDGPPARAKVEPEESHNQSPPWRYYRVEMLSLVCGYVSAVFIEVATESGRIGRLISDRITAEVSKMIRSDFRSRAGCQLVDAFTMEDIFQINQLGRIKGLGIKTIEKVFRFATDDNSSSQMQLDL